MITTSNYDYRSKRCPETEVLKSKVQANQGALHMQSRMVNQARKHCDYLTCPTELWFDGHQQTL